MAAKKYDADRMELLISAGLDIDKRRIYFGDVNMPDNSDVSGEEVSWKTVELAIRNLHILQNISNDPIELHMCSMGGCTYSMHRLVDEIQNSPCKITFVGGGMIMSSAVWIMLACDERQLYPSTIVMVHHGSSSNDGSAVDLRITQDHLEKQLDAECEFLAKNSFMPKKFWGNVMRHDVYLSAQEAKACGICESIIDIPDRHSVRVRNKPDEDEVAIMHKAILKRVKMKS